MCADYSLIHFHLSKSRFVGVFFFDKKEYVFLMVEVVFCIADDSQSVS